MTGVQTCALPIFGRGAPILVLVKTLRIAYKINGGPVKHVQFRENEDILLPQ